MYEGGGGGVKNVGKTDYVIKSECSVILKVNSVKRLFFAVIYYNVQWIKFFIWRKNYIFFSRYLDLSVFHKSTNFKIYDVIIDITAYQKTCFLLFLLNAIKYEVETWWNISITYEQYF